MPTDEKPKDEKASPFAKACGMWKSYRAGMKKARDRYGELNAAGLPKTIASASEVGRGSGQTVSRYFESRPDLQSKNPKTQILRESAASHLGKMWKAAKEKDNESEKIGALVKMLQKAGYEVTGSQGKFKDMTKSKDNQCKECGADLGSEPDTSGFCDDECEAKHKKKMGKTSDKEWAQRMQGQEADDSALSMIRDMKRKGLSDEEIAKVKPEFKRYLGKTGAESLPPNQKTSIDTNLNKYPSKFGKSALAKAWGNLKKADEDAEYEKEKKEHPDFSDEIIRQIVADHKKEKMGKAKETLAQHSAWVEHGHEPEEIEVKHSIGATEFAILDVCFLKAGEYRDNAGTPHRYDWDVIERDKDTFKGKKFYIEHKEDLGYEYGLIEDIQSQKIDNEDWIVGRIKVPEVEFTQDVLARIESGLAIAVSNTNMVTPDAIDGHATKMRGRCISLVKEGEVPGARVLNIQRHVAA